MGWCRRPGNTASRVQAPRPSGLRRRSTRRAISQTIVSPTLRSTKGRRVTRPWRALLVVRARGTLIDGARGTVRRPSGELADKDCSHGVDEQRGSLSLRVLQASQSRLHGSSQ